MVHSSEPNRRDFLVKAGAVGTASFLSAVGRAGSISASEPSAFGPSKAKTSGESEFLLKSQQLPAPDVRLPTDALPAPSGRKKRIAAITTAYWKYSHADDIITKFIEGYGVVGRIHLPHCKVVSLYIEQFPKSDIGRGMAARYGIPLFDKPAEALTLGGDQLDVDGVLLIGEHGEFPLNSKGQKLYPRRRLFEEIVKVFRQSGRSVPVFNDKHLSYSWQNANWMYQQSRGLKFPLMAGSSVPVTWRHPPLAFRPGIELNSALVVGSGSFESYGFHCLEFLQTFVEKRRGGEVGVKSVQTLEGDAAWNSAKQGGWRAELIPAAIGSVPDSQKRKFEFDMLRKSVVFRIEYSDGFVAAVCRLGGLVSGYNFGAAVRGLPRRVGTHALLPQPQRDHFSFLCNHIEVMFRSGRPSYPVERTLLTTGILDALHDSRAGGGKRIETPHLSHLKYTPAPEISFETT